MDNFNISLVEIDNGEGLNFILGQSHFIKTVEDIHEAMVNSVPGIKFGIAFCEASGDRLIRYSGTDNEMIDLAKKNAVDIAAGHSFIIFMENAFPLNVLGAIKRVPEVVRIFCATANKTEVVVLRNSKGNSILGVIDGYSPLGVEGEDDVKKRKDLLRNLGYKL